MKLDKTIDTPRDIANGRWSTLEELSSILSKYSCGVDYKPMSSEVAPLAIFPTFSSKIVSTVQPDPYSIPLKEAEKIKKLIGTKSTFILIPGQKFDVFGTRHGRGGGWYDQFLSFVPQEWLRIGFCYQEQFIVGVILGEEWDMPMDFVCSVNKKSSKAYFFKAPKRTR